jgi:HAD superfamily hydrolase (TIGR01662 family)
VPPTPLPTTVVIPTIGRPSLHVLLDALDHGDGPKPAETIVVDDRRPARTEPLLGPRSGATVVRSGGRGPAAARNLGWRLARTEWVSFLDDDVVPEADWAARLAADLVAAGSDVLGIQGRVTVPLPTASPPTDWERGTSGLQTARWITADMSYRRSALARVGGFDERFRRAFREDADLALRVAALGGVLVRGSRGVTHPVRPESGWVSIRVQRGNADDMLMRRLHGRRWRDRAAAPAGRRAQHVATTAAAAASAVLALTGRQRWAAVAAAVWAAATADFAARRIAPGPRDAAEVTRMVLTSAVIPAAATWHSAAGLWRHRTAPPWRGAPDLVLFDRDDTIVANVPYNGDPALVVPVTGARQALDRLRAAGVKVGVVTNQSGVADGRITPDQVDSVNARVEELLGPMDVWRVCPHGWTDGCGCRKPSPGLVSSACADAGVDPGRCVVVGDIGSDIEAAAAAGAVGILVPTVATRVAEIESAEHVQPDLAAAVDTVLRGAW